MRSRQALGLRNHHYFLSEGIPSTCGFVSSSKRWLRYLSSTALCPCSGVMSIFWWLQASWPASSRRLAVRYSRTPVRKTGVCQLRCLTQWSSRREAVHAANRELKLGSRGAGQGVLHGPTRALVSSLPTHYVYWVLPRLAPLDCHAHLCLSRYQCLLLPAVSLCSSLSLVKEMPL